MAGLPPTVSGPRPGWPGQVDRLSTLFGWISAGMIMVSVIVTCQMIFVRAVLGQSTVWQTELVTYLMVAATLLGLPYVQKLRGHVNVDLVPLMLRRGPRKALAIFTLSLSILVIGVMVIYGFEFWHKAWERNWKSETIWAVRLWIPYAAVPVGLGMLLLQLAADLWATINGTDKPFNIAQEKD